MRRRSVIEEAFGLDMGYALRAEGKGIRDPETLTPSEASP